MTPIAPILPPPYAADPLLSKMAALWQQARGPNPVAPRNGLNMRALGPCLPWFVIAEEEAADRFTYRLVGSRVREITGSDHTGHTVEKFTPPEIWPLRLKRLQLMLSTPCGMVSDGRFSQANGQTVEFRALCLPISGIGTNNRRGFVIQNSLPVQYRFDGDTHFKEFSVPQGVQFIDIGAGLPAMPGG